MNKAGEIIYPKVILCNLFHYYGFSKEDANTVISCFDNLHQRIDKASNELITLYQIVGEQPSQNLESDNWLLKRIESIQSILKGENNEN